MPGRTFSLALFLLVGLFALAACTPGNSAPSVTITSPADGAAVVEGNVFVLAASATDAEDGDLSDDVAWSSDLDGPLTPDASDEVQLSVGTHVLTASTTDSAGRIGTDSVTVDVTAGIATHVVTDGLALRLVAVDGAELVEIASASIPSEGLSSVHMIFNVVPHPSEPWLYAASANECSVGTVGCWGNARIDRFVVDGDTIEHDGAAFVYDATQTDVSCAQTDSGYGEAQVGTCAPNGMAFSSGATRFYVDDDDLDGIHVFDVAGDGDLTFVAEGGTTRAHGLALDPTDSYLYNGASVIDVTADVPSDVVASDRGNATTLVDRAGRTDLISTDLTRSVGLYDLADPLAPVEIAAYDLGADHQARDLAFGPSLDRIVTVGRNVVHSLSFAPDTFTLDDTYTAAEAFDIEYRGVALAGDGAHAVAAWFGWDADVPVGGIDLFTVAGDGTLDRIDRLDNDGGSRVVIALP